MPAATASTALDRAELLVELMTTVRRASELLEAANRQATAAVELLDGNELEGLMGRLKDVGGFELGEFGELDHRLDVLRNSVAEVDAGAINIAEWSSHEVMGSLDSLLMSARKDVRDA